MDKVECAGGYEKLENFIEQLPYYMFSGEDLTEYGIPGAQRTPAYFIYD
jgi:hypothetical protein